MITELATVRVRQGAGSAFETAFAGTASVFSRASGCLGSELLRSSEDESRYVIKVFWETVEHHTVIFNESPLRDEFIAAIAEYLVGAPEIGHYRVAVTHIG